MLGISLGLGLRTSANPGSSLDPVVTTWQASGGSADATAIAAMDAFFKGLRTDGIIDKFTTLNLMCGTNLASCLLSQIGVAATNGGGLFQEADYSQATGLTGNGTTKYLDLGFKAAMPTGGLWFYSRGAWGSSAAARTPMGAKNPGSTQIVRFIQSTTPNIRGFYGGIGGTTAAGTLAGAGMWHLDRGAANDLVLFEEDAVHSQNTSNITAADTGVNVYLFAENNGSNVATGFVVGPMAGYGSCSPLTNAEEALLYTRVETFQDALARGVN